MTRFIRDFIDRLETLEILALLMGDPSRRWTADEVTKRMRSSRTASKMALDSLVQVGLAAQERQAFLFQPQSAELEEGARSVLDCYRNRRTAVIAAIYRRDGDDRSG